MNVLNEDCKVFLQRPEVTYDYILTSPPDYLELGLEPKRGDKPYAEFLRGVFKLFNPRLGVVSLLVTDKKKDSRIYPKHRLLLELMDELGWILKSQKIWVRRFTQNVYSMPYSFILTFARPDSPYRQSKHPAFMPDVYHMTRDTIPGQQHRHIGTSSFPVALGRLFTLNFTEPGEIVCDPFMGSGSTALAALADDRDVVGSELDPGTYGIFLQRVASAGKCDALNMFEVPTL